MPSKKKKYNARFPAGRIKKIMQSDEEVGKVAQAVPIIISRTLELFVESLLNKTMRITNARNAKTLSTSHMKQCIMSESRFDFLRELVKNVPDISVAEEQAISDSVGQESGTSCSQLPSGSGKTSTIISANGNTSNIGGHHLANSLPLQHSSTFTSASTATTQHRYAGGTSNFFMKDISDKNTVIQYIPKLQTQKSDPHIDTRPTKLKRGESMPAGMPTTDGNMYANSLYTKGSPLIPTQTNISPTYKINLLADTATNVTDYSQKTTKKVPPLTPIKSGLAAFPSATTSKSPSTSSIDQLQANDFIYPSTSIHPIKIDVSQTAPILKINYNNLDLSKQYYPHQLPSTSSESATKNAAMINIDLLNNCTTSSSAYKPISTTSNTLEMDEDYDNI